MDIMIISNICLTVQNTIDIIQTAQIAHIQNTIALIYGPAGCGKTTALQNYARTNNNVIYVEADVTTNAPRSVLKRGCSIRIGRYAQPSRGGGSPAFG